MGLVLTVFLFVFAVIRICVRSYDDISTPGRVAVFGEWVDYRNAHCDKVLEEEYHKKILEPNYFEEIWGILTNAWENDRDKIMQMDKKTVELWKLLMEVPYAPFFRMPDQDSLKIYCYRCKYEKLIELDKKYKLYDYVEVWGNHQWLYNFMRAKHCLMTLRGLKSVDVAEHEWVSHIRPGNAPHKDLWTYNGKEALAKAIREYGKRPSTL